MSDILPAPRLASSRIAPLRPSFSSPVIPLRPSFSASVAPDQTVRDAIISKSSIDLVTQPEKKQLLDHIRQLRLQLQWKPAARLQLLMFRNTIGCVIAAVLANGCFYSGNIFSSKSSAQQSRQEFLMATLVWTAIVHAIKMTAAYLPSMMTQRFRELPDYKPSLYFCLKKLIKGTFPYFLVSLSGMIGTGLLVQNTSLMNYLLQYKLHFYIGVLFNMIFTAGIAIVARQIYYEEANHDQSRREYIAIGCSQSIIFWWSGHPFYPSLQLDTGAVMSPGDKAMWRFNQVGMLGFQFVVEIFVDYVCVVVEMATGIDFARIESRSAFLGVVFMMMAVLNINISSLVYLSFQ
ncbi:hypothetical protein F442_16579 [Phytophthora nicotianae P10297]|uniref:Uncharacterized protein n=4 Tax=Phytophthora nicotianae TaxID=4792 RepID=W2PS23_PHYN3|nr:hypothetical protein PPTG_23896 [Phytophthora nicotianae INRA-310]ETN02790.1 hypothetical protein PPTG_23896 [Phytophthora nicotianae INRA-310]ETP35167.1 hypothetical protein F442_16579 [Phytophthora nicotianae P10297]